MEVMADDYRRIIRQAAALPIPPLPADIPSHFTDDHSDVARSIVKGFGIQLDILDRI
jgi:hypothetical protein